MRYKCEKYDDVIALFYFQLFYTLFSPSN